jgi:hypothetical protein
MFTPENHDNEIDRVVETHTEDSQGEDLDTVDYQKEAGNEDDD